MNASFRHTLASLTSCALLACGGTTQPAISVDGAVTDSLTDGTADSTTSDTIATDGATDTSSIDAGSDVVTTDGASPICDEAGVLFGESTKQCHAASECTFYVHQTDCCGDTVLTGVTKAALAAVTACESTWDKHFPGCGCAEGPPKTDDGKTTTFGATPTVTCGDFTTGGGICLTSTP
ncbi:MAG: hypothetical protein ACHREM_17670 [Polyangiales bacterium]